MDAIGVLYVSLTTYENPRLAVTCPPKGKAEVAKQEGRNRRKGVRDAGGKKKGRHPKKVRDGEKEGSKRLPSDPSKKGTQM